MYILGYVKCFFRKAIRNKKEGIITIKDNNKEKGLQQAHIKN